MTRKLPLLRPHALRDLTAIDEADGWWQARGPAAALRLAPVAPGLPTGWVRLAMTVRAPRVTLVAPTIGIECGDGYRPLHPVLPCRAANGRWTMELRLPPDAASLVIGAPVSQGPFHLGAVELRPVSRILVGARLALSLGRDWLRNPGHLVQSAGGMKAAWCSKGWSGLYRALCQAMLAGGPVAEPPVPETVEPYRQWVAEHEAMPPVAVASPPRRFSILLPVGPGEAGRLPATLATLQAQPDADWECLIGFAPGADAAAAIAGLDLPPACRATSLETAERGAMLAALAAGATGELLLVLDPGDRLAPAALAALATVPDAEIIHGDEDRIGSDGTRSAPFLKPEWSPELLEAFNYFGRPTALSRTAVARAGGFAAGRGAGAEWDLHLRLTAGAASVARLPHILCHRPVEVLAERPPADRPEAAALRATLAAHWQRQGIAAEVTTQPDGTQRATWPMADPPLVSIIVPSRGQPALLERCLQGILERTDYPGIELLVVGDGSADPATLAFRAQPAAPVRIRLVRSTASSSHAVACNAGAREARGALLLFLDCDITVTRPDWLEELVRYASRPGVGVVGTMIAGPDGRPLHAGVTIGMQLCGGLFRHGSEVEWGAFGSAMVPRTLSAVAGGCQMVRREVFAQVGGFDETYAVANSDVALCLAARAAGWRTAYTPFARLVRHAGCSRGRRIPPEDLTRTALDIRRLGYRQDPFFHPALDAGSTIPRLRMAAGLGNAASLERDVARHGAGATHPALLDLGNDADVAEAVGLPVAALSWPPVLPEAIDDRWSAARWCLDLLRRRTDLRRRFPDALSAGANGAFAEWITGEGGTPFALPEKALASIREALAAGIAARARQAVLVQAGLSDEMALAFLPPGRASLLGFLLRYEATPLRREEIWWLALECAEDPARELVLSYRFNPGWQALFPDGLTIFGRDRMAAWLRASYRGHGGWADPGRWPETMTPAEQVKLGWNSRSHWQRYHPKPFLGVAAARALVDWLGGPEAGMSQGERAWLAAQPAAALSAALAAPGLNVVGHFCYPSGLRTSALSVVQGLRTAGYDMPLRDVAVDAEHDLPHHAEFAGLEVHDTTLLHIQPEPLFVRAFDRSALQPRRPRTYRIGYWYWEMESVPASWAAAAAEVDELWTATRFVGDTLRSHFRIPVFELMPGVELPPFTPRRREEFGIPPGRYTFLFAFHMMSIMERKNPLGLIRAFRRAFAATEPVMLILKTSFGAQHPALLAELHAAAAESGGKIMIIDRVFTADETISLMDSCDCYVSLHRTEGLGLTMAEAMLLAKPVIGTRYSGNLDFMDDENSLLVDYELVEIGKPVPPYESGSRWANPSEAHAAQLMRRVWENQDFAAALGRRAQARLRADRSMAAAGQRMADRLAAIHLSKGRGHSGSSRDG